jgi:hypothetical protein
VLFSIAVPIVTQPDGVAAEMPYRPIDGSKFD